MALEPVMLTNTSEFQKYMVDASEFLRPVILQKMLARPSIWTNLIPKDVYPDGMGYTQTTFTFHPGMGDMAGLTDWEQIQASRAPGANGPDDPGYDACTYRGKRFDYGFTQRTLQGYRTARYSPAVCYQDVRFKWQFQQQLRLIFGFMADVTADVWENLCREAFLNFARKIALTNTHEGAEFSYNPFNSTQITIPQADFTSISMLSYKHLEFWSQYLALQCREGASGEDAGLPLFELVVDPIDLQQMIEENEKYWEAFLYANPNFLLENYGKVKTFKGFIFLNDSLSPRFAVAGTSGSNVILERVLPYKTVAATTGTRRVANPEYIKAEYGVAVIRPKNVYRLLIPQTQPSSPDGRLKFGTDPSWLGEFIPINIPNEKDNLLGEKCYFFARYAAFLEPLENVDDAIAILYKRCPRVERITCSTPVAANTSGSVVSGSEEAVDINDEGKYTSVRLTLDKVLSKAAPCSVTVTFADSTTASAMLTGDATAPTYVITFSSANTWITQGGGISTITVV